MRRYYEILGVEYDAPLSEVRRAYRDLVMVWHPDRFAGNERLQKAATEKLIAINEAYRFLRSHALDSEATASDPPPAADDTIDWGRFGPPNRANEASQTAHKGRNRASYRPWFFFGLLLFLAAAVILATVFFGRSKYDTRTSALPAPVQTVSTQATPDSSKQ